VKQRRNQEGNNPETGGWGNQETDKELKIKRRNHDKNKETKKKIIRTSTQRQRPGN
jgi:hypothetical protein